MEKAANYNPCAKEHVAGKTNTFDKINTVKHSPKHTQAVEGGSKWKTEH